MAIITPDRKSAYPFASGLAIPAAIKDATELISYPSYTHTPTSFAGNYDTSSVWGNRLSAICSELRNDGFYTSSCDSIRFNVYLRSVGSTVTLIYAGPTTSIPNDQIYKTFVSGNMIYGLSATRLYGVEIGGGTGARTTNVLHGIPQSDSSYQRVLSHATLSCDGQFLLVPYALNENNATPRFRIYRVDYNPGNAAANKDAINALVHLQTITGDVAPCTDLQITRIIPYCRNTNNSATAHSGQVGWLIEGIMYGTSGVAILTIPKISIYQPIGNAPDNWLFWKTLESLPWSIPGEHGFVMKQSFARLPSILTRAIVITIYNNILRAFVQAGNGSFYQHQHTNVGSLVGLYNMWLKNTDDNRYFIGIFRNTSGANVAYIWDSAASATSATEVTGLGSFVAFGDSLESLSEPGHTRRVRVMDSFKCPFPTSSNLREGLSFPVIADGNAYMRRIRLPVSQPSQSFDQINRGFYFREKF